MAYHHFKGDLLGRSDKIQRKTTELILSSKVPDAKRENSVAWELKHSASCVQVARILAIKRGLNLELCEVIASLHDLNAIETGTYEKHAEKSAELARELLSASGDFSEKEIGIICNAIACHSDKNVFSTGAYAELIKDADCLDCYLYLRGSGEIYVEKPAAVRAFYLKRISNVLSELGLNG